MSLPDLIVLAFAAWRGAYLITHEDAPFAFMKKIRERWPLGGLLNCQYCASIWTAAICYGLMLTPLAPFVYVLAISGLAMMFWRYTGGDHV